MQIQHTHSTFILNIVGIAYLFLKLISGIQKQKNIRSMSVYALLILVMFNSRFMNHSNVSMFAFSKFQERSIAHPPN